MTDKQEPALRSVAFSPNGKRLASGGDDNTIRLWDAEKGVELATLCAHNGAVTSVAFSGDGRIFATASADRTVVMWELYEASPTKRADQRAVVATGQGPNCWTARDSPGKTKSVPQAPRRRARQHPRRHKRHRLPARRPP
jgi:WD40 repeat protein